jgi:predicted ATP-dependent serine protease
VSTVKFDLQEDLEELQARIYLDTKKKLSKKDILELTFRIGAKNYEQIIQEIQQEKTSLNDNIIDSVMTLVTDFGEGTEKLSSQINKIVYDLES